MPNLSFQVESIEAEAHAAAPQLVFKLQVRNANEERIHSVALNCQLRIDPTARSYTIEEKAELVELFGEPSRWGQTVRNMLWTHATAMVPAFAEETSVRMNVPCTFDFNVAATKYFHALDAGDIAVSLLFSGTIFHAGPSGMLQVAQVPWDREAKFRLPVSVWRTMMDQYYPNSTFLNLGRDTFNRLAEFKAKRGLATFDQTLERLLAADAQS